MVQESTNTFSDGLIKDLNPLTTPNTVLTDALNATLLTFNGNELVLQNDLGNTKIIGAKLPEGYVPLGIKEFGGILYIVSSNGENIEIGSFPSPEMVNTSLSKIDPKTLDIFINSNNNEINKNIKLSSSSFKSGDNFLIILDTIQGGESFISSYTTRKIYKPKLISIANGVELDITNTLTQQRDINNGPNYYSWFIDGNPSESDINLFKSEKITQIYKSRKSGEIYLRFDLENIDKFYLNNTINNTSAYPIISRDEQGNYHLTFSFYLENNSYIKCNEISLKYTLTNLDTGENTSNTIKAKLAYPFINGLTYDIGSIVYNNGIYYRSKALHSYEDVSDDSFWENLGNYESAITEEPLLKPYSSDNQYDNIFDINFGNTRNQLINYEVTPLNTLFDISFDDFTITDNLDLSKDNISWSLSPYWAIIPEFYSCEENALGGSNGYKLFNVVGRFGNPQEGGNPVPLDANDLPLENNNKQAIIIKSGTTNIQYNDYNIISTFTLDSNFNPIFNPNLFVTLPEGTEFRVYNSNDCSNQISLEIEYNQMISSDDSAISFSWPSWMADENKPATLEMNNALQEGQRLDYLGKIVSMAPVALESFGSIQITPEIKKVATKWSWNNSEGTWKGVTELGEDVTTPSVDLPPIEFTYLDTIGNIKSKSYTNPNNYLNRIYIDTNDMTHNTIYTISLDFDLPDRKITISDPNKFVAGNPVITDNPLLLPTP